MPDILSQSLDVTGLRIVKIDDLDFDRCQRTDTLVSWSCQLFAGVFQSGNL